MTRTAALISTLLSLAVPSEASAEPGGAWIDRTIASWNAPGAKLPAAPASAATPSAQCDRGRRAAASDADRKVEAAGWRLFGSRETYGGSEIVRGLAGHDGMCRPLAYQVFVFVDGAFAGTLAPAAMDSRSDGAIVGLDWVDADHVAAEFSRYDSADPLCCPSRRSYVNFAIERRAEGPVVLAKDSSTESVKY